jgi:hypothetical protein
MVLTGGRGAAAGLQLGVADYLVSRGRFVDSVKHLAAAATALGRHPLRAGSPQYISALRRRAQAMLDCNDIPAAVADCG